MDRLGNASNTFISVNLLFGKFLAYTMRHSTDALIFYYGIQKTEQTTAPFTYNNLMNGTHTINTTTIPSTQYFATHSDIMILQDNVVWLSYNYRDKI
jgi:hypothetical protein